MPRPQFTLRTLLVAMLVVGAFYGGMAWQQKLVDIELTKRAEALDRRSEELDEFQQGLIVAAKIFKRNSELLRWAESQGRPITRTPDDDEIEAEIEKQRREISEIRYSGGPFRGDHGRRGTTPDSSPH